ncbi:unnamed protein product, partial [Mesorhabditis spiculigera]
MLRWLFLFLAALFVSVEAQCPSGWAFASEFNSCLNFNTAALPFWAAEQRCLNSNGHLLSVHNAFQNTILTAYLGNANLTGSTFWLGLWRNDTGAQWKWTDGTASDYFNWQGGNPGSKMCGSIAGNGGAWNSLTCENSQPFICAYSTLPGCLPGWQYFKGTGMCYYHGQNASFPEAEHYCQRYGGHLASVHTNDENDFISNMTWSNACVYSRTWITGTTLLGGTFDQSKNMTRWWSDSSSTDYAHNICQNEGTDQNVILLRAFPMNKCPQDEEKCGGGNWRIGRYANNDSIAYPDYVCKAAPVSHTQCPIGWSYYSLTDSCYFHGTTSSTFWNAEQYCNAYSGNLASIHSVDENEFIQSLVWNPTCAQTMEGFQRGEVLIGGIYSKQRKGISYWTDGSASDYSHATCDLFGADSSTIVMAAHPRACGSCFEGQWYLPRESPDSGRTYGEFICKSPTYAHLKRK